MAAKPNVNEKGTHAMETPDGMFLRIPVLSDEGRERTYERFENISEAISNPVLTQFVDFMRFKTLGDTLDANPITLAAMMYMIETLEDAGEHILVENSLLAPDEDGDLVWVNPRSDRAPYGIRVSSSFDNEDSFSAYMDTLSPKERHAIIADIVLWANASEMYAALQAICDRLRIAIHDAVEPPKE